MLRVLTIRATQAVVVLVGITAACFFILNLTGDPAALSMVTQTLEAMASTSRCWCSFCAIWAAR